MDDNNNSVNQLALLRALQQASSAPAAEELMKANPSEFHNIVTGAAENNPMIKANVTPYSADDYAKFKTYLTADKQSGYAIKPGHMTEAGADELISVFSKQKGRGNDILKHAVDVGKAKQLDAFDINNKLPSLYGKEFTETSRFKFDPQYAPQDWDYKKLGTPDVIGMKLDESPLKTLTRGARQVGSAIGKTAMPALALGAASYSETLDDALTDTLVPGGVEGAGMSAIDDKRMLAEIKAAQNYEKSPAFADKKGDLFRLADVLNPPQNDRKPAVFEENQAVRQQALRKLTGR